MSVGRGAAARTLQLAGQVQAFGLASAAAVAERYIGTVDRYLAGQQAVAADLTGFAGHGARDSPRRDAETVELPPVAAGGGSEASVWVHNPTVAPVLVELRVGRLTSATGHELPVATVAVAPGAVTEVPPGGAAEVRLRVQVPPGTPPGHFHGVVTSTATPRQAVPVHLEVRAGGGRP